MKRAIGNEISAWASDEGVFIGPGIALVRRLGTHGAGRYQPRLLGDLNAQLSKSWGREVALTRATYETLTGAGIALDRGELVFAGRLAELVRLPLPAPGSPAALAKYRPDQAREANGRFANEGRGATPRTLAERTRAGQQRTGRPKPSREENARLRAQRIAEAGGRTHSEAGVPVVVPEYKKDIVPQRDYDEFRDALEARQDLSPTRRNAYAETFAAEGGFKTDDSSKASSGITPDTLRDLQAEARRRGDEVSFAGVSDPAQLTADQRVAAYDYYLETRGLAKAGGAEALDQIDSPHTAAAVADTLFQHGATGGGRVVQQSVNDVIDSLPPAERERLDLSRIATDGVVGRQTLDAVTTLDGNGYGQDLRDSIAEQRRKALPEPNLYNRYDHFRFPGR